MQLLYAWRQEWYSNLPGLLCATMSTAEAVFYRASVQTNVPRINGDEEIMQ